MSCFATLLATFALFIIGIVLLCVFHNSLDSGSGLLIYCGLPSLPIVVYVFHGLWSLIYDRLVLSPKREAEEKRLADIRKKNDDLDNQRRDVARQKIAEIQDALVEGEDFIWGHLVIVKCANGHRYQYGDFRFVSSYRKDTTYDEVATATTIPSRMSAIYTGSHIYPVVQSGTTTTSYKNVPYTTQVPVYSFGCPLCHTRIHTIEAPYSDFLLTEYNLCTGENCSSVYCPSSYDDEKAETFMESWLEKYELLKVKGGSLERPAAHWNGSDFVPIFYRKKYAYCPLNDDVSFYLCNVGVTLPKQEPNNHE